MDMKQFLVELDDRTARDLEKVAPAKERKRADFVRLAIRRAIDLAMDRATRAAYERFPESEGVTAADLEGWDEMNELAVHARRSPRRATRRRGKPK